jgi:hypothetical protein
MALPKKQILHISQYRAQMSEKEILDLITSDTSYRVVYYKILQLCGEAISDLDLLSQLKAFPEMKNAVVEPYQLIRGLAEVGAIARMSEDPHSNTWKITDDGQKVKTREAPENRILDLFVQEPDYIKIYMQVINFCRAPRKRQEIETNLNELLKELKGVIYPQYFIVNLESIGAIEWVDSHWQTTQAGQSASSFYN